MMFHRDLIQVWTLLLQCTTASQNIREIIVTYQAQHDRSKKCGFDDVSNEWLNEQPLEFIDSSHNKLEDEDMFKYNLMESRSLYPPTSANNESRFVELVLVTDSRIFKQFDRDEEKIKSICQEVVRKMNRVYKPLNIYIVLVGVVIWKDFNQGEMPKSLILKSSNINFISHIGLLTIIKV